MNARSDEYDPRFDPAFQRGFDATKAPDAPRPAPREVRRANPVRPPAPTADTAARPGAVSAGVSADAVSADPERADAAALDAPPRRNPFLLALGVVSVALVAAGVWGIQAARAAFLTNDAGSSIDFVGLQILQFLSPASIALGVATAVGILFVYAVGWQKRG